MREENKKKMEEVHCVGVSKKKKRRKNKEEKVCCKHSLPSQTPLSVYVTSFLGAYLCRITRLDGVTRSLF